MCVIRAKSRRPTANTTFTVAARHITGLPTAVHIALVSLCASLRALWCARRGATTAALMNFCPVPHTKRDQIWLGVGVVMGGFLSTFLRRLIFGAPRQHVVLVPPKRLFKLAVASEMAAFKKQGRIESNLDKADGFIHLSDKTSPTKVAQLFFKDATDLHLIELDAARIAGPVEWVLGVRGDKPPPRVAETTVHYLIAEGCVHVYSRSPVSTDAIVRSAPVPLGADGVHRFPEWL